jgi:hypothetical protein
MSNFYSFEIRLGPAGRSDYFFFKLKRRRFRKKNKNQRVSAEFLTGFCQVNQVKILPKLWVEKLHAGC